MKPYLFILSIFLLIGCAHQSATTDKQDVAQEVQDALFLLNELSAKNKQVDKLMLVKSPGKPTERLAKDISKAYAAIHTDIKKMNIQRPKVSPLPKAEKYTRQSIAKSKQNELLGKEGKEFKKAFLLTQVKSLEYAQHLIQTIQDKSKPGDEYIANLVEHQTKLKKLQQKVESML